MRAELYHIERAGPGTLSVMARPRGADWLADEIHTWQQAGVNVIVSMLTPEEQTELDLEDEALLCEHCQLVFRSLPIPDRALPPEGTEVECLVDEIGATLRAGKHVALHCRTGIGRSAMIAAAALVARG